MRVAIVNDYLTQPGGGTAMARFMAKGLAARGHEVIFVCGTEAPATETETAQWNTVSLGLKDVRGMARLPAALAGIFRFRAASAMSEAMARIGGVDAVIVHQWTRVLSPAIFWALQREKVFVVAHDFFGACPNGAYFNFRTRRICGLMPLSTGCVLSNCDRESWLHKVVRLLRHSVQSLLLNRMKKAGFLFVSNGQKAKYGRLFSRRLGHHVLSNVPPWSAETQPPVPAGERSGLLFVGRLVDEKGPAELAHAARAAGASVCFVGDGPEKAKLEAEYPEHQFIGWRNRGEVREIVRRSRALLIPSLWAETSALSAWEGAFDGAALAVSNKLCTTEELNALGGVRVFDPADPVEFSALIRDINSATWDQTLREAIEHRFDEADYRNLYFKRLEVLIGKDVLCA